VQLFNRVPKKQVQPRCRRCCRCIGLTDALTAQVHTDHVVYCQVPPDHQAKTVIVCIRHPRLHRRLQQLSYAYNTWLSRQLCASNTFLDLRRLRVWRERQGCGGGAPALTLYSAPVFCYSVLLLPCGVSHTGKRTRASAQACAITLSWPLACCSSLHECLGVGTKPPRFCALQSSCQVSVWGIVMGTSHCHHVPLGMSKHKLDQGYM
jgi:hypothetical protein